MYVCLVLLNSYIKAVSQVRKPESLGTQKGTVRTQPPSFRPSVLPVASGHPKWRILESKSKKHLCFSCICLLLSKRMACKPCMSRPSHKHVCAGDEPDSWASHEARTSGSKQSRKEELKDSFIFFFKTQKTTKRTQNSSPPVGRNLQMFSCLTEIFLSTTSAERCKINLGKAGVETVWLPENRLSCERFHLALPVLLRKQETGVLAVSRGGSALATCYSLYFIP